MVLSEKKNDNNDSFARDRALRASSVRSYVFHRKFFFFLI